MNKICSSCKIEKSLDRFVIHKYSNKNGETKYCFLSKCKDCRNKEARNKNSFTKSKRKITRAIYYKNNKSILDFKNKVYYKENKEIIINRQKEYAKNNSDKIRASKRISEAKRRKNDPLYNLRKIISAQVRFHLFKNGKNKKKGLSILNFLNYTLSDLKNHLEEQFEKWMTWNNYGPYNKKTWDDNDSSTWTWSLDHIIPQYKLPYTSMEDENFKRCWDLSNLRPLSAKQNLLDGVNKIR